MLYQRHPAIAHSDFTVLIVPLMPGVRPTMGWHDLQVSNRLSTQARTPPPALPHCASHPPGHSPPPPAPQRALPSPQVSKRLLLLYVQQLGDSVDTSTPSCLARFAAHERMVRRWVPESHRP